MKTLLDGAEDIEETKRRIEEHVEDIEYTAEQALKSRGKTLSIRNLRNATFPRKSYGDCTFPAGRYQALRVCIGKAEGKNWWCVYFFLATGKCTYRREEYESLFDWEAQ